MSKETKSQPKIIMVQLIKPARFGKQGVPLDNIYIQGLPSDTSVDSGPVTVDWDVDPRFLRVVATKTGYVHLLPLINVSCVSIRD